MALEIPPVPSIFKISPVDGDTFFFQGQRRIVTSNWGVGNQVMESFTTAGLGTASDVNMAQIFTVGVTGQNTSNFILTKVRLIIRDDDPPNTVIDISIEGLDINDFPNGTPISTGQITSADLDGDLSWRDITMTGVTLEQGKRYALTIRENAGDWTLDRNTSGNYEGGIALKDAVGGWESDGSDLNFEVWGAVP